MLDPGTGSILYNPCVAKKDSRNGSLRSGELARLAGVSSDTLRHYERKGLLAPRRSPNGYREYPAHALDRVRLIRSALAIGFKLDELARILKIRDAGGAPCHQVRALAQAKLDEIDMLVREITEIRDELQEVLKDWDKRLESVEANEPAKLLESLAGTRFAVGQKSASFISLQSQRKRNKDRK
ncbi:MAG: heavy metal-responsive transcriptional regulator [Acidobacteria bacterium]|nr:heavy metal-responsive transcriptional regulator [Acidobacteriota bacterium]